MKPCDAIRWASVAQLLQGEMNLASSQQQSGARLLANVVDIDGAVLGHGQREHRRELCDLAEVQGALAEQVRQERYAKIADVDAELARREQLQASQAS